MESILKEGVLKKRSLDNWRERKFYLTSSCLQFTTLDGFCKDSFNLQKSSQVTQFDMETNVEMVLFPFKVTTGDETLILSASSAKDRLLWIEGIQKALSIAPTASRQSKLDNIVSDKPREYLIEDLQRRISIFEQIVISKRAQRAEEIKLSLELSKSNDELCRSEENVERLKLARRLMEARRNDMRKTVNDLSRTLELMSSFTIGDSTGVKKEEYDTLKLQSEGERNEVIFQAKLLKEKHSSIVNNYKNLVEAVENAVRLANAAELEAIKAREVAQNLQDQLILVEAEKESAEILVKEDWVEEFYLQGLEREKVEIGNNPVASSPIYVPTNSSTAGVSPPRSPVVERSTSTIVTPTSPVPPVPDAAFEIDLSLPRKVDKKLGTDSKFYDRFVWFDEETGCFYWSKKAGPPTKYIHVKSCVKNVIQCHNLDPKTPAWFGLSLVFFPHLDERKHFAGAGGLNSANLCIDLKVSGHFAELYAKSLAKRLIEIVQDPEERKTPGCTKVALVRHESMSRAVRAKPPPQSPSSRKIV